MTRRTFSDDTTTGGLSIELRGGRRVTVVARAEDPSGFEWLAALKRDLLPAGTEAKAKNVLPLLESDQRIERIVLRQIASYAIFIVDLHALRRDLVDGIITRLGRLIPHGVDPYDFVLELPHIGSRARLFLQRAVIDGTVLGRLEALLDWCSNPFADGLAANGLGEFASRVRIEIANRAELERLDDRQLASFLARLGAAVGDALSPERHAKAMGDLAESRFFSGGHFAFEVLRVDIETDKTYDVGGLPVLHQLQKADGDLWERLQRLTYGRLSTGIRRGVMAEEASHLQLGLQAADIAAALARHAYESAPDDARVAAVKRLFERVMVNGQWV